MYLFITKVDVGVSHYYRILYNLYTVEIQYDRDSYYMHTYRTRNPLFHDERATGGTTANKHKLTEDINNNKHFSLVPASDSCSDTPPAPSSSRGNTSARPHSELSQASSSGSTLTLWEPHDQSPIISPLNGLFRNAFIQKNELCCTYLV